MVAIGPLTNIALAMKFDPELATRLKTLFIMGGNIGTFFLYRSRTNNKTLMTPKTHKYNNLRDKFCFVI